MIKNCQKVNTPIGISFPEKILLVFLISIFLISCDRYRSQTSSSTLNKSTTSTSLENESNLININYENPSHVENKLKCNITGIKSFPVSQDSQSTHYEYEITYLISYNDVSSNEKYVFLEQKILDRIDKPVLSAQINEFDGDIVWLPSSSNFKNPTVVKRLWKNQKQWSKVVLNSCSWWSEKKISQIDISEEAFAS